MKKIKLSKNLRKNILRGHPWVYRDALDTSSAPQETQMVELLDTNGKPLAWGIYDSESELAMRVLSAEKKPPGKRVIAERIKNAIALRDGFDRKQTNCFRLINGEGDRLPGLVCDVYNDVAVVQFDGPQMEHFWQGQSAVETLDELFAPRVIVLKSRHQAEVQVVKGELSGDVDVLENGVEQLSGFAAAPVIWVGCGRHGCSCPTLGADSST